MARRSPAPVVVPPWPGRMPWPSPALVLPQPLPAVVLDADGAPVGVSARLEPTAAPAWLLVGPPAGVPAAASRKTNRDAIAITGWVGPWPIDERWWAPDEARRRARFQVQLATGPALLLFLAEGHWSIEAIYD